MTIEHRPQIAIAALITMLSRYSFVRCPAMVPAIVRHLRLVAEDEHCDAALRETSSRLHAEWTDAPASHRPVQLH